MTNLERYPYHPYTVYQDNYVGENTTQPKNDHAGTQSAVSCRAMPVQMHEIPLPEIIQPALQNTMHCS